MPFLDKLLKEKPKTPAEVVSKLVVALELLDTGKSDERTLDRAHESVAKYLGLAKQLLFGDDDHEATKENAVAMAHEACRTKLLSLIVRRLADLEFESRKDAAQIFGAIVRIKDNDVGPGTSYIMANKEIPYLLFRGYDNPAIALNCGAMLRDCVRDEQIARVVLGSDFFPEFFPRVELANFEVASDAFATFKDLLTRHKGVVAQYLQAEYPKFFEKYLGLLTSTNYVVRRQSLKLLGELLLDRSNVKVMLRFVSDVTHLKVLMMLLRDQSRAIQFEAFHVFKVFVANPNKPQPVTEILTNNREKLLKYLEDFHTDREEDEQFKDEKAVIIKTISQLGSPAPQPAAPQAQAADATASPSAADAPA